VTHRRSPRLYLTANDAKTLASVATEIEDRTDDEHEALLRLCDKIDRLGIAEAPGFWRRHAEQTWQPSS
jgi:hypothetical protein